MRFDWNSMSTWQLFRKRLFVAISVLYSITPNFVRAQFNAPPNSQTAICAANPNSQECRGSRSTVEQNACAQNPNSPACLTAQQSSSGELTSDTLQSINQIGIAQT